MYARYWKINQASWFSRRGNIESHKTESGFNNQVVVANVLNMYVKKWKVQKVCRKEKKQVQKVSRKEKWKVQKVSRKEKKASAES